MSSYARHWLHAALAQLWSAGHVVPPGVMHHLDRASYKAPIGWCDAAAHRAIVADMLRTCGFAANADPNEPCLPNVWVEYRSEPRAGHAVRLTGEWSLCKPGAILVLSGSRDWKVKAWTVGRGGHYWDGTDQDDVSLSAGGPSSIVRLPRSALVATTDCEPVRFWRFRDRPEAHTGVDYYRSMPVWEWSGSEADFERFDAAPEAA